MNTSISARELFDQLQQSLGLRWLAGRLGKDIRTDRNEITSKRPSLSGYLNVIHPNKVQILGIAELAWLDRLDARVRWENIEKISIKLIDTFYKTPFLIFYFACFIFT